MLRLNGAANPFRKEQYANRETRILASLSYRLLNQDLNLGPPDYESGATNQLSYGSVLFRSSFRCREAVVRTGAQKYINSVEMQKKAENFFGRPALPGPACRLAMRAEGAQYPFSSGSAGRGYRFGKI